MWKWLLDLFFGKTKLDGPLPPVIPPKGSPPAEKPSENTKTLLFNDHNTFRRNNRVPELLYSSRLGDAAQVHADWMAHNRNMSHVWNDGTTFTDRIKDCGYTPRTGGENTAAGQRSIIQAMDSWMHSTGHRQNILSAAFKDVGFGVAQDAHGNTYWCSVFATESNSLIRHINIQIMLPEALVTNF